MEGRQIDRFYFRGDRRRFWDRGHGFTVNRTLKMDIGHYLFGTIVIVLTNDDLYNVWVFLENIFCM